MRSDSENRIRKEIAQEAARLVTVEGFEDYLQAKKKAANQLGINNKRMFPSNNEIESAIIEYQSLFQANEQSLCLKNMRQIACKLMTLLSDYEPRLVGSVLSGTANQYSELTIHLFSDTPEFISLFLEQEGIPVSLCERRIKIEKQKPVYFTAFKFIAGEINIVLIILPANCLKMLPVDPVTGKTMKRARLSDVEKLIKYT